MKKMLNIVCCAKLLLDPNSEISCLKVVSFLGRRAFEKLDCPKSTKFFVFEACDRVKRILKFFLKLKMKLNSKKYLF